MKVRAKETCNFNNIGNNGVTFEKDKIYEAERLELSNAVVVKHPNGAELGFNGDFEYYFKEEK